MIGRNGQDQLNIFLLIAALGVLGSVLGFSSDNQALMIALYIAMDSFGTACNVTGDGAIALVIDRFHKHR